MEKIVFTINYFDEKNHQKMADEILVSSVVS